MKNKTNNRNITAIIVGVAFVALFTISIAIQIIGVSNAKTNNNIELNANEEPSDDWSSALKSDEKQLIYLGTPSCSWCNKIRPELDSLKSKYGVDFVYINMSEINEDEKDVIFNQLEINENEFGTPYLVVIENGKKVDEQVGYAPEAQLQVFYQTNGLINNK